MLSLYLVSLFLLFKCDLIAFHGRLLIEKLIERSCTIKLHTTIWIIIKLHTTTRIIIKKTVLKDV
jgi:hypothetical protein